MHEIKFTDVQDFAKNGKVIMGPCMSRCGRPVLILRTRMEDKANAWDMNIKHFAYQMEMVSRCALCDFHAELSGDAITQNTSVT